MDEIGVLGIASSVKTDWNCVLVSHLVGLSHVLQRNRLTADRVVGHGHDDRSNVVPVLSNEFLQARDIHVALERGYFGRIQTLRADIVDRTPTGKADVGTCGVEEGVRHHELAGTRDQ